MGFVQGLVSITFRQLSPEEILDLCQECGLGVIEWGGDIHVPTGDLDAAHRVAELSSKAGVIPVVYGSYWRAGQGAPFELVLETANALGAPRIRVWAGVKGSAESSPEEFEACVYEIELAAEMAGKKGQRLTVEIHPNTLTDTPEAAQRLLSRLDEKASCHWQPSPRLSFEENLDQLGRLRPWVQGFHVFHWLPTEAGVDRLPLAEGRNEWEKFLDLAPPGDHWLLHEFVKGDDPDQLRSDAAELRRWIEVSDKR